MFGLSGRTALAGGLAVSPLSQSTGLADAAWSMALPGLSPSVLGAGRNGVAGHQAAVDALVPGDVAGNLSKERTERAGLAAGFGSGRLSDRVGDAAQAAAGDGASWTGASARRSGGG